MAVATELDYIDVQLVGDRVTWSYTLIRDRTEDVPTTGATMRAMYARLARDYDARPAVRNTGGGLPGDLIPL